VTESRTETLKRLQAESYATATEKGWHDRDELDENGMPTVRQMITWCGLFHTEVTEYEKETAHYYLEGDKPCGKITELADVAIRVWDAIGRCGFEPRYGGVHVPQETIRHSIDSVIEQVRNKGLNHFSTAALLSYIVDSVFFEASSIGYDFDTFIVFIEQKMAYNRTRSTRHGGKLA
jgi:hypothetical protein